MGAQVSRLRFSTAREVYETFPVMKKLVTAPPTDEGPKGFVERIAAGRTPEDAIGFCAFLLPRREAVWWALQSVRALQPQLAPHEGEALKAADAWVRQPDDAVRRHAKALADAGDANEAATWVAWAAGYSGGSMHEEHPVPCPPDMTGIAARCAVLTALARAPARERTSALSACVARALRLTDGLGA